MSRKKTSESVDEILKEVREQNAQAAAQSAASDTQVDLILASLGMGQKTAPISAVRPDTASFTPVATPARPQPASSGTPAKPAAPTARRPAPASAVRPAKVAARSAAPAKPATAPRPAAQPSRKSGGDFSTTANLPKTASEVQRYFRKTSPADELEDPRKLLQQEQRFVDFFGESVAVIPDSAKDKPVRIARNNTEPEKKPKNRKNGFFGFGRKPVVDEETGEILIPAELNTPVDVGASIQWVDEQTKETTKETTPAPRKEKTPTPAAAPSRKTISASGRKAAQSAPAPAPQPSPAPVKASQTPQAPQSGPVVRPGVEHQGTLAFPYRRTPRSNRTHIKTIEFEPAPRPQKKRTSPTITMHISLPEQQRRAAESARRTPPASASRVPSSSVPSAARSETLVPPPQDSAELTPPYNDLTRTGAIRLEFANKIAEAINHDGTYEMGEEARRAADILTGREDLNQTEGEPARGRKKFHLFGHPAEEDTAVAPPPFEESDAEPDYVDDYNRVEDAPLIRADLQDMVFRLRLRGFVGGLIAVLLLVLDITARSGATFIDAVDPTHAPLAFLGVNLLLLVLTCVLNRATLIDGIVSFRGNPSTDTVPFLACIASAVQLLTFLILPQLYEPTKMTIFAGFAALLLCVNAFGKSVTGSVVTRNFDLVSNGVNHVAAYTLQDEALLRKLTAGLGERRPCLLVSRPTPLVKGFITNSFAQRQSDRVAQNCALLLLGTGVICTAINAAVQHSIGMAVSVLPAVFCFGAPLCSTLVSAIPEQKMHQSASRVGAVIPGWTSIRQLGRTNVVLASATDLFPAGSVSLHGIKTFEKERIDTAILYAASILVQGCDTLQDVFLNIIQNNRDLLMKVENLTTELGGGFVGWIENNRVIVGNRTLMEKYDIELPSLEYEKRFTQGGRKPIYLAVAGKLFGMFLVSYTANPKIKEVVDQLHHSGISLLLSSEDFSVDSSMVEAAYGLPQGSVKVLSAQENDDLAPAVAWLPESDGCMIHLGKFASYVGGLQAASGAAAGEKAASMVMIISVIISCVISLALSVSGNNAGLALPVLMLYQIVWSVISLVFPLIQKY